MLMATMMLHNLQDNTEENIMGGPKEIIEFDGWSL